MIYSKRKEIDGCENEAEETMGFPVLSSLFAVVFVLNDCAKGSDGEPWLKSEKHAELGTEVLMPCILKLPQCGELHSIKWYQGPTRIFVFSEGSGLTRGTNDIATRSELIYIVNTTNAYLKIPKLKLEDEGLYKCEATYMSVKRECNNVQHVSLNVTIQPNFIRIVDEKTKTTLSSGTTLGPVNEGTNISLKCESGEGKPVPIVEWFKDDEHLEAVSSSNSGDNGIGTGSSQLEFQVTRSELGSTFTCKASSPALVESLTVYVKVDVNVRPLKMDLKGVVGHVIQGTNILLRCTVSAARPPANVTWYNQTTPLGDDKDRFDMFKTKILDNSDGTFETTSYLAFTATEFDNGNAFSCHAENLVTRLEGIKPMKETTTIEVLYRPVVALSPSNLTVNETEDFLMLCEYKANPATLIKVKWLRDGKELELNEDHYVGGITEQTALKVKNSTRNDMGIYTCILENSVGESTSEDFVNVSVLYRPVVEVTIDPEIPVNEADRSNVSLTCEVITGNPTFLTAVRWYLDGDLLKELPDCTHNRTFTINEDSSTFCDIDPSKLLLESVGRSFHGNYSCEGRNDAGWGPVSSSTPVIVYYEPGPASISYQPQQVVKKNPLNITCSVVDPGRPEVIGFKWLRGHHRLADEKNPVLKVETANLKREVNFTCMAYNEAGDGDPATAYINVSAAPTFIKNLSQYHGFVYNSVNVSIECWVECAPICDISWLKEGVPLDFSKTTQYYVSNVYHPPNPRTNDFESIQSTLIWNMTSRPDGQLDRFKDNGNFTCESSSNVIGPGVKSETRFHVEFPPENMTISKKTINVIVDHIPENVICGATGLPQPTFKWYREGSTERIGKDHILNFQTPVPQRSTGTYFCEATNRHGSQTISLYMNVQFRPKCQIDRERVDNQDYVVCWATANPKEVYFTWSLKNDNDTLEQIAEERDGKSYILLDNSVTSFRTYVCRANNTVGFSIPCELDVLGNIPWWSRLEGDLLIIIIIVAAVIVLVIIIICVIVCLICRRKRNHQKYPNQAANNNHVDSVSESLPEPETKTFYENLPFHGIQTPPDKVSTRADARVVPIYIVTLLLA